MITLTLELTKLADVFPEEYTLAFFAVAAPIASVSVNLGPIPQIAAAIDKCAALSGGGQCRRFWMGAKVF